MRRQLLNKFTFDSGYTDSKNLLKEGPDGFAEGSCNQLVLGESVIRPFKGFNSKGTATGTRISVILGNTWGGLKDYSGVTASGSLIEDFSKTLYAIGAGTLSKEGIPLGTLSSSTSFTIATGDVNTSNGELTEAGHTLALGDVVTLSSSGGLPTGFSANTAYYVTAVQTNTFKLASSFANAQAGTYITPSTTGSGTHTVEFANMRASTSLKVASVQSSTYLYTYFDSAGLDRPDAPVLEVPATVGANYAGQIDGAISFKVAGIRDRNNQGSNLTDPQTDVHSVASTTSAVVAPARKTVKITFPTAETGQTHWAVFATKVGFGGTGVHYRVGYRTSSAVDAQWIFGIPETTVDAATNRTLEFDFRDGDLLPEEAWLFDYVPPQGTHFLRLENVGVLLGAYDGSVGAVSLPNQFESYHPRHLIYFPEPVTAVLHRQVDDYAYIACRNSIHAIQYVGYRGDDLPSATITTITPEVGISNQQNWTSGAGMIVAFIEGAGIVRILPDGTIDYEFGKEVSYLTRSWAASSTVVGFDPNSRSFVIGNGGTSVSFCTQSMTWAAPVYATDFSITGNWQGVTNSRGEMIVSFSSGPAYSYDTGASRTPIASIGRWQRTGTSANIYEVSASIRNGNSTEPLILGIHQNLFKTFVRGCSTTNASANLTVPSGTFTSSVTGKQAIVTGTDVGGVGTHYLIVKLTYSNATTVTMSNRSTGAAVTASATLSNVFIIVGEDFEAITPTANVDQHQYSFYPSVQDCRSYTVSAYMATDATSGGVIEIDVLGTVQETSEAKL